jgi:aminopeptidase N
MYKHIITIVLFAWLPILANCQVFNDELEAIIKAEKQHYHRLNSNRLGAAARGGASASNNFDVGFYRCEWQINPAVRFITGKVTSYFKITSLGSSITYDLFNTLTVDSVLYRGNKTTFTQVNNTVKIDFVTAIPTGSVDSVSIFYKGAPPTGTGFGSYALSTQNGQPITWTLSQPYGSMEWWPCKNNVDDKADSLQVIITTPSAFMGVSNGNKIADFISGANRITHWKHRYPITSYLVCMAATNYVESNQTLALTRTGGTMPYNIYAYPDNNSLPNGFLALKGNLQQAMNVFEKNFGAYPYQGEPYAHTQFGWGGGMEHQTNSFMGSAFDDQLAGHELGHQWFGDLVTCASYKDIWLNEGFATHLNTMYRESLGLGMYTRRAQEKNFVTSQPEGSLFVADTTNVSRMFSSRLTYFKGSHVIFMLRYLLGDSVFFKGMRNYLNDPAIRFGYATTQQLQKHLETTSGKNLTEFFKDWYTGEGQPSYQIKWNMLGNNLVKIKVNQTQSSNKVSYFELPIMLVFRKGTVQDTMRIENSFNGEEFIRPISFEPDTMLIDPQYWLITRNNTSAKLAKTSLPSNAIDAYFAPRNPNNIQIVITDLSTETELDAVLFTSNGQRLWAKKLILTNGTLLTTIPAADLPKGGYVLQFIGRGFKKGVKLVK